MFIVTDLVSLINISLISFLRDKAKQCRPRSETYWVILHAFLLSNVFKVFFFKKFSRVSNIMGQDPAKGIAGPDMGPSNLQRLSVEHTRVVGKV